MSRLTIEHTVSAWVKTWLSGTNGRFCVPVRPGFQSHKFCSEDVAQLISVSRMNLRPHDHISRWRIVGACEAPPSLVILVW